MDFKRQAKIFAMLIKLIIPAKGNFKALLKLFSISGSKIGKTIIKTLCLLLIIFIVLYLVYEETKLALTLPEENFIILNKFLGLLSTNFNTKEIIELLFSFFTIIASLYACRQIYFMKDINRTEMCHEICTRDQTIRANTETAKKEMKEFIKQLEIAGVTIETEKTVPNRNKDESKFHQSLLKEEFSTLRLFAHHYEYIGYLTLRDKLNFNVAFDTITYPDFLMHNNVKEIGRVCLSDFWNGSEYLYASYEVRRKHSDLRAYYLKPRKTRDSKEIDVLIKNYFSACQTWLEKYNQIA